MLVWINEINLTLYQLSYQCSHTLVVCGLYWTLNQLSYQCSLLTETFFLLYITLMQDQK